ncbi:MAG: signal peptidase I [Nanoarchaeota archaeon]|nr:signal peptidase I [Nanoarchaeota archaeon]
MGKPKTSIIRKIWHFIWEEDSALSWIVNIILAFVIIKFIVMPGLGLVFHTSYPVVAVVSGSMEHAYVPRNDLYGEYLMTSEDKVMYVLCQDTYTKKNSFIDLKDFVNFDTFWEICGNWYQNYNITKEEFKKYRFRNGFNTGDIIVLFGKDAEKINVGEVIVFRKYPPDPLRPDPIIHRVVNKKNMEDKYYFQTKGDHNPTSDPSESNISEDQVIGYAVFRIPYLGYIKIWVVEILKLTGLYKYIPI